MGFRLHGNASSGTKENDPLRHLLDDGKNKNKRLDDISRGLAFSLACTDFQKPVGFSDNIFDKESFARSRVLLRTCRRLDISDRFLLLVARWSLQGVELKRDRLLTLVHCHRRKGLMVWYRVGFA